LVRSRTIKSHKLMNRRHMPVSNPLSIGLQIGLRALHQEKIAKIKHQAISFAESKL